MSKIPVTYKRTDLQSDQEVKWCPDVVTTLSLRQSRISWLRWVFPRKK